jgi:tetratricopeptide (TPR) repeat protein
MSLAQLGCFDEAEAEAEEALRLAEPTQHAFTVGSAEFASGTLHLLKGDWTQARMFVDRAVATFRTGGVVAQIPYPFALSAWVLARLGEAGEAMNRIQEGERLLAGHGTRGIVSLRGWSYHALGRAALLLGRHAEARRLAELAIDTSAGHHGFMAHALHLRADITAGSDKPDVDACAADYRQALSLAEPRGMRPLAAHCQLGLGRLFLRNGKRKQARQHLAAARDMYGELGMAYWVTQAEAELVEPRATR